MRWIKPGIGALLGGATGAFVGLIVIPLSTQEWLFTTTPANIRAVSGPVLLAMGLWVGIVLADLALAARIATRDAKLVRHTRWSAILGAFAILLALSLWCLVWFGSIGAVICRALSVIPGVRPSHFASPWLLLANALAAGAFSIGLGVSGIRADDPKCRRRAALGGALGVVSICIAVAWLLAGGFFCLFWAI